MDISPRSRRSQHVPAQGKSWPMLLLLTKPMLGSMTEAVTERSPLGDHICRDRETWGNLWHLLLLSLRRGVLVRSPCGRIALLHAQTQWVCGNDEGAKMQSSSPPPGLMLQVSLQELMGVNLTPEVRIQVDVLEDRVLFTASEFALGGDPRFKEQFQMDLKSTLQHKPVKGQQRG
eukprot:scaffold48997_cov21-Tisochrysis_lutea.AAC.1